MIEKRRENRFACNLPVSVKLRDGFKGPVLAGPAPASLHDISSYGASLIVPQIRFGNYHLFYSSRDNHPHQILFLEVPTEGEETLSIPVRPTGFDRVLCDETMPFQIGVQFIVETDTQVAMLKKLAKERRRYQKSWWKTFLQKLWPSYESNEEAQDS
jgi:hypothetical protein